MTSVARKPHAAGEANALRQAVARSGEPDAGHAEQRHHDKHHDGEAQRIVGGVARAVEQQDLAAEQQRADEGFSFAAPELEGFEIEVGQNGEAHQLPAQG
jgi:hypothetical protein